MSIGGQTVEAQRHRRVHPVPTTCIERMKIVMRICVRFPRALSVGGYLDLYRTGLNDFPLTSYA